MKQHHSFRPNLVPRHSLLSAIEFRDVVQSLRKEAASDRSQQIFQSWDPESFLPHHHHHRRQTSKSREIDRTPKQPIDPGHKRSPNLGPVAANISKSTLTLSDNQSLRNSPTLGPSYTYHPSSNSVIQMDGRSVPQAGSVDDPWREHLPDDGCEPLGSPALPLDDSDRLDPLQHHLQHKTLSKLQIPKWNTTHAQQRSEDPKSRRAPAISSIKVKASPTSDAKRSDGLWAPTRVRPPRSPFELVLWKVRVVCYALFPALRHLHAKSWLGCVVSFITSPAIFLLNLTLPVVDDEADGAYNDQADGIGTVRLEGEEASLGVASLQDHNSEADADEIIMPPADADLGYLSSDNALEADEMAARARNSQRDRDIASALHSLPVSVGSPLATDSVRDEAGSLISPGDIATSSTAPGSIYTGEDACTWEEEAEEQELRKSTGRFLILMQCIFAPTFVVWAIASSTDAKHSGFKMGIAALCGLAIASLSFVAMRSKDAGKVRYSDRTLSALGMIRCSMGFLVSVMWIMTIVDEVVSILQTVGLIVGLSDAILGLTVFAIGNSLGDMVANITIARLGHPVMAISACFAGPMLNLLLGIGISGTWLLSAPSSDPSWSHGGDVIYPIEFSPTLLVSGLGLLLILISTLIAVPMNDFHLTRSLGLCLIGTYLLIMTVNLLTEVFWV
jgi:sodium/potassium/calcium exchanger 6